MLWLHDYSVLYGWHVWLWRQDKFCHTFHGKHKHTAHKMVIKTYFLSLLCTIQIQGEYTLLLLHTTDTWNSKQYEISESQTENTTGLHISLKGFIFFINFTLNVFESTQFSFWVLLQQTENLWDKEKSSSRGGLLLKEVRKIFGFIGFTEFKQTHTRVKWPCVAKGHWLPWEQGCWAADSHTETDVRGKDEGTEKRQQNEKRAVPLAKANNVRRKAKGRQKLSLALSPEVTP